MLIVEAEPPKTVNGSKPLTMAMDRKASPVTVKVEVRSSTGTRFSLFVICAGEIVFVCRPRVVPVTYTSIRQRCPEATKPFVSEMDVAPVGAVNTMGGAAPHPVTAGGVELLTVTPVGRLSVIEKFVRSVSLGAKMSILNLEFSPARIVEGENDLIPATSVPLTITFAFTGRRLPMP